MKKILFLTVAAALLSAGFAANAQDVDGISLWDKCTKEQLIKKYGQPTKYYSHEPDFPEDGEGLRERIYFKDAYFRLEGNKVTEFAINTTKPRAMTKLISGGIRIGDSEESLKKYSNYQFEKNALKDGKIQYWYLFGDDSFFIITKNGKIVYMYASATTT